VKGTPDMDEGKAREKRKLGMPLRAMQLLAGQTEEITMMDFRRRPGDMIDQVQMGKTFVITKSGHVVAVLSQPKPNALKIMSEVRRLGLEQGGLYG